MPEIKLKWRVAEKPSGMCRSFYKRGWPTAYYHDNGEPAFQLICDDRYEPANIQSGNHAEIKIMVADYRMSPWIWRTLKKRAATLKEAKEIAQEFIETNPSFKGA